MHRKTLILTILLILLIISVIVSISIGSASVSLSDIIRSLGPGDFPEKSIILDIRLPRILNTLLAGAALSCSGMILQSLFRNNLAEPGLLGISAGAGLGAIIIFLMSITSFALLTPVAFLSAMLTTLVIYYFARSLSNKYTNFLTSNKIILAGIAINALLSSVNGFLLLMSGNSVSQIIYWLSGGFSGRGWNEFSLVFIFIIAGLILAVLLSKEFNVLMLGEELSVSAGLNVKRLQRMSIAISSLLAASAVSVAGIISFVGLIIPNISRLLIGSDHRYSIPGSILLGGIFLVISDTIARTIISPSELPVGIVTSFIGAPVFIWLIFKKQD